MTCKLPDCERDVRTRGWCNTHYERWRKNGDVAASAPIAIKHPGLICSLRDCDRRARDLGMCSIHGGRRRRHGDPLGGRGYNGNGTVSSRDGYRKITVDGVQLFEHRLVMESVLGRRLDPREQVHHIDGDKLNNDPANLQVLALGEHQALHAAINRQKAG